MPQLTADQIAAIRTNAENIADANRKKVVLLALDLEGNDQVTWQGGGNLENFLSNSKSNRTPKNGVYISLVCWLWPIYVAWRCKVAKKEHLNKYRMTQQAAIGTANLLHQPGVMTFGGRDESAMGAAAFYQAAISSPGLGVPGDIVFYYRSGYEQPCHIAIQVSTTQVSSLWTVPRDANGIDFMWPQVVASTDLATEIRLGLGGGGTVDTRHRQPPWA